MKVTVCYSVLCEVDIPEEEIKSALAERDYLRRGHLLNKAAQAHNFTLKCLCNDDTISGEISGVYDPTCESRWGETIWEG